MPPNLTRRLCALTNFLVGSVWLEQRSRPARTACSFLLLRETCADST